MENHLAKRLYSLDEGGLMESRNRKMSEMFDSSTVVDSVVLTFTRGPVSCTVMGLAQMMFPRPSRGLSCLKGEGKTGLAIFSKVIW